MFKPDDTVITARTESTQTGYLMIKVYKFLFTAFSACWLLSGSVSAQVSNDTTQPTSIDVNLENLFTQKVPKKYKITDIVVTGNKYFDQTLL